MIFDKRCLPAARRVPGATQLIFEFFFRRPLHSTREFQTPRDQIDHVTFKNEVEKIIGLLALVDDHYT